MDKLKSKLLDYSIDAPENAWDNIRQELDKKKVSAHSSSKNMTRYFLPLAAAILVIIFCGIFFINKNDSLVQVSNADSGKNEKNMVSFSSPDTNLLQSRKNEKLSNSTEKIIGDYITIASADGNPVKVSSKAATLIVFSDNQYPPKAIWSAKVNKWKARMLSNPVTPTTSNFLDIADLTEALDDQNNSDN